MNHMHDFANAFFYSDLDEQHKIIRTKSDWTGFIVGFQCGPECPTTSDGEYAQYKVYMPQKFQYSVPQSLSERDIVNDLLFGIYQFIEHDMDLHELQEKSDQNVVWCFYGLFTRLIEAEDKPPGNVLIMMPHEVPEKAKIYSILRDKRDVSKLVDQYKTDVGRDDVDVFIGDLHEIWT